MTEDLAERVRSALGSRGVSEKKMFGGICFLLNDHMVAGASKRGLLLRIGKENHPECISRPHVRPMEMSGRKMSGYIYVAPEGVKTDTALREWLDLASAHVRSLPPKGKKAKPKERR